MKEQRAKILILGIGNILLCDEGIGVRVIEYLQKKTLPEDVELVDGGTAGADLIDVLADRSTVIIIDAADFDAPAGTILRMTPQDWLPQRNTSLSLHDLDIPQTLTMTKMLGCAPEKVICFGVVPETIQPGMILSPKLAALVPVIADRVLDELRECKKWHLS